MANLLGNNIGSNYRGILNIGSTINTPLGSTLSTITDGMGNNSTLQLSTSLTKIDSNLITGGATAASARLHVRGDGTNPIFRFENGAGVQALAIANNGAITIARDGNIGPLIYPFNTSELASDIIGFGLGFSSNKVNFATNNYDVIYTGQVYTTTSGTANYLTIRRTFSAAAGNGNFRPLNIEYTINNSGAQTGTATGIFINATLTSLNGMIHNFIDIQSSGISRFRVSEIGGAGFVFSDYYNAGTRFYFNNSTGIAAPTNGNLLLSNFAGTDFNRLQFGGTTNLFPSLKRSGANLEVRLADDSGFASIEPRSVIFSGENTITEAAGMWYSSGHSTRVLNLTIGSGSVTTYMGARLHTNGNWSFGDTNQNDSALVSINSTTKGFLLPRMTTAQKNAISSPANGLIVFDTTLNKLCVFTTIWETITSA